MKNVIAGAFVCVVAVIVSLQIVVINQNKQILETIQNGNEKEIQNKNEEDILTDFESSEENIQKIDTEFFNETDSNLYDAVMENIKKSNEIKRLILDFDKRLSLLNSYYEQNLEEQRKKTIDITATDSAVGKMKEEARRQYTEKKYSACAKTCRNILSYEGEDYEVLVMKFKSLYYSNPSDGSKFYELLNDFDLIEKNRMTDEECKKIKEMIIAEKGIDNE